MQQILINYLGVFIFPFLFGFVLRICLQKWSKVSYLTMSLFVYAVIMWILSIVVPSYGSEANGIRAIQCSCLFIGSFIFDVFTKYKKR